MYVYVVLRDNGYEFGSRFHEERVVYAATSYELAELLLAQEGFTEKDEAGYYWRGCLCSWIRRCEVRE